MRWYGIGLAVASALVATSAFAVFRAADMVVVPTAVSGTDANSLTVRTDLQITNVDTVPVDAQVLLLPCCDLNNVSWFNDISNALGGRTEEGYGHVDGRLAGIVPGATVELDDVITTNWTSGQYGALVVFAYQAGTLMTTTPPGGVPKLILVNSRTYSVSTDSSGNPLTYGQQVPGIPWHDYIDANKHAQGFDHAYIVGLQEDANFSTSLGLVNISDRLTVLNVSLTLIGSDGTALRTSTITLLPLDYVNYDKAYYNLFAYTSSDPTIQGASVRVQVAYYSSNAANPVPALLCFGSRIDNHTSARSYLEQAWDQAFPWDCIFNGRCTTATGLALSIPTADAKRRPLDPVVPTRRPVTRTLRGRG